MQSAVVLANEVHAAVQGHPNEEHSCVELDVAPQQYRDPRIPRLKEALKVSWFLSKLQLAQVWGHTSSMTHSPGGPLEKETSKDPSWLGRIAGTNRSSDSIAASGHTSGRGSDIRLSRRARNVVQARQLWDDRP